MVARGTGVKPVAGANGRWADLDRTILLTRERQMPDEINARPQPDRRSGGDRRGFFRGGRRQTDWPHSLTEPLLCPRCGSPETRFLDGTPDALFWECHACRQSWSTRPDGTRSD
jgi:hypothetical protein